MAKRKPNLPFEQLFQTTLQTGFQTEKTFIRHADSEQMKLVEDVLVNRNMFLKDKISLGTNVFGFQS